MLQLFHGDEEWITILRKPWWIGFGVAGLLVNILTWSLIAYKIAPSDLPIFLHYNIYLGIDRTGPWFELYLMPLVGLVILVGNIFLSILMFYRERVISILLMGLGFSAQVVVLAASALILLKNVSL